MGCGFVNMGWLGGGGKSVQAGVEENLDDRHLPQSYSNTFGDSQANVSATGSVIDGIKVINSP